MSDNLPAIPGMSGGSSSDNGFIALSARTAALAAAALFLKEGMHLLRAHMGRNAAKARRVSEMCDAAEVEPQYTAMILDASASLTRVSEASGEMTNAADAVDNDARGFNSAHDTEYRGVYEAVNGSGVRQAKPGFYRRTGRRR
ncbi:conjugal transfer protein TraB [Streptomyces sp. NPDC002668]|uniref:conjugal transfer protein TraB n=1 Tax=Streptomyces sp. NPDC002668 TaxID=3154422 RepID=UPI0033289B5D